MYCKHIFYVISLALIVECFVTENPMDTMELVKIAKSNLRIKLKNSLSQMSAHEIAEQSKIIANKVR